MSRPPLFGRGVLRCASLSLLAVSTLLAGTLVIEGMIKSRNAVLNLESDIPSSDKLYLGLNIFDGSVQPFEPEPETLLRLPLVDRLPYRQQCIVGLFLLGGVGLVASIRPFDPEQPILQEATHPASQPIVRTQAD